MKYIIFDMDGVILDSERIYWEGCMQAAEVLNIPKDLMADTIMRCTGVTWEVEKRIVSEAFQDIPGFTFDKFFRMTSGYFDDAAKNGKLILKPGVHDFLQFLKENEYKIGLASSTPLDVIRDELGGLDVLPYFDVIVSGDMVEHGKPDPEIFLKCAEQLKIPPSSYSDIYVVEDSYNGIRAAYQAGMKPVMIPDRLEANEEMREKAEMILDSLWELMDYFNKKKEL